MGANSRSTVGTATDQSLSSGPARAHGFTDLDGSRPDCWRYMVEVQDPGLPAVPARYRCAGSMF